jgi:hypothetical protein
MNNLVRGARELARHLYRIDHLDENDELDIEEAVTAIEQFAQARIASAFEEAEKKLIDSEKWSNFYDLQAQRVIQERDDLRRQLDAARAQCDKMRAMLNLAAQTLQVSSPVIRADYSWELDRVEFMRQYAILASPAISKPLPTWEEIFQEIAYEQRDSNGKGYMSFQYAIRLVLEHRGMIALEQVRKEPKP